MLQYLVGLDFVGVGAGTLYGVNWLVEDFLVKLTDDRRNGEFGHIESY